MDNELLLIIVHQNNYLVLIKKKIPNSATVSNSNIRIVTLADYLQNKNIFKYWNIMNLIAKYHLTTVFIFYS